MSETPINTVTPDYYWREYFSGDIIPQDAIVGGQDENGANVYIGEAYVKDGGLMPSHINPKSKIIYAPLNNKNTQAEYIKILCGHQRQFSWISTSTAKLHEDLTGKHPVIGGHQDGGGRTYIGRKLQNGLVVVGKVDAFRKKQKDLKFYFTNGTQEIGLSDGFEVLVYAILSSGSSPSPLPNAC